MGSNSNSIDTMLAEISALVVKQGEIAAKIEMKREAVRALLTEAGVFTALAVPASESTQKAPAKARAPRDPGRSGMVLDLITSAGTATTADILKTAGTSPANIQTILAALVKSGKIVRVGRGEYSPAPATPPADPQ